VFFSMEMSVEALVNRLASAELSIPYGMIESQRLGDADFGRVEAFAKSLKGRFYAYTDVYHVERQMDVVSGIKPGLVIVDYIQKARTGKKCESKRLEIEHISGLYKQMASENKCVVLILSQLSRPVGPAFWPVWLARLARLAVPAGTTSWPGRMARLVRMVARSTIPTASLAARPAGWVAEPSGPACTSDTFLLISGAIGFGLYCC